MYAFYVCACVSEYVCPLYILQIFMIQLCHNLHQVLVCFLMILHRFVHFQIGFNVWTRQELTYTIADQNTKSTCKVTTIPGHRSHNSAKRPSLSVTIRLISHTLQLLFFHWLCCFIFYMARRFCIFWFTNLFCRKIQEGNQRNGHIPKDEGQIMPIHGYMGGCAIC